MTLLELLEDTAAHVDCFASAEGPHDNCFARKRADALRAYAAKIREMQRGCGGGYYPDTCLICRINGGPAKP